MLKYFFFFAALLCIVQCNTLNRAGESELVILPIIPANHSVLGALNIRIQFTSAAMCNRNLDGYEFSPEIGAAHKLHFWSLAWNNARKACYNEGGQLVVINSATERDVLVRMLQKNKINNVWLGVHDLYEKGDWTTVTGLPLAATGFTGWGSTEPNNAKDNEHCVELTLLDGPPGMNDNDCSSLRPFICEISIPVQH